MESREPRNKLSQFLHLAILEIDKRRSHRAGGAAYHPQAGLDDGDSIALAAVSNPDIGHDEIAQAIEHGQPIPPPHSPVKSIGEVGKKIEEYRRESGGTQFDVR